MSFNLAEFQSVIDKIDRGVVDVSNKMQEMPGVTNAAINHWYVPSFIAEAMVWLCDKMVALAKSLLDKIVEVLKGIAAPVYFYMYSQDLNGVSASAEGVVANLADGELVSRTDWKGDAATAYRAEVTSQRDAAGELGSIADEMAKSLIWAAVAGLLFYVGLATVIVKFLVGMCAAVAALGSLVLSWAGAAYAVQEAAVDTGFIVFLVSTLGLMLGDQAKEMLQLQQKASSSKFPHGAWPKAIA